MEEILSVNSLKSKLDEHDANIVIVDVRFNLNDAEAGRKAYINGHLPQAIYIDLDQDLSAKPGKHGGRHPLPSKEQLAKTLGNFGINNDSIVVVYDDDSGVFASRFWWTLKHLGHENVAILDGGYSAWLKAGYDVSTEEATLAQTELIVRENDEWQAVDASYVKSKLNDEQTILIDARHYKRYAGIVEPVDPIGGHIPGANNIFWKNVLQENGLWKEEEQLKQLYRDIPASKEVIVYCGSGVSACPNVLSLKKAGYKNVKLYAGSWSDWITYEDNPIAKIEE